MAKKRKLYGKKFGIPYDFSRPTIKRMKQRWWNPKDKRLFTPKVWGIGWTVNFGNPKSVFALLVLIGAIALAALYLKEYKVEPINGPVAICIDCIPGSIGGGCTYIDKNTGETVQPKGCQLYDETKVKRFCPEESRDVAACIQVYQPVCGSDARTYSNSCFACMNEHVIFYLEWECSEVVKEDVRKCDALNPCSEGECVKFPDEEFAICHEGDLCERCESGNCVVAESYPLQIFCK